MLLSLPLSVILEGAAPASLGPIITTLAVQPPPTQVLVQMVLWRGGKDQPPLSRAAADRSAVTHPPTHRPCWQGVLGKRSLHSLPFRSLLRSCCLLPVRL